MEVSVFVHVIIKSCDDVVLACLHRKRNTMDFSLVPGPCMKNLCLALTLSCGKYRL